MLKAISVISALLVGAVAFGASVTPAEARVFVGFGFGYPYYPAPYYGYPGYYYGYPGYYPDPYYYAYPPPAVYAPPPAVYAPPPVAATPGAPPPQSWYYCDDPKGYYPYVASCPTAWRQVPATPPGGK
jgi:hypothetical protein